MLSFFPRGVLDEILNLIESVSEGFPTYSFSFFLDRLSDRCLSIRLSVLFMINFVVCSFIILFFYSFCIINIIILFIYFWKNKAYRLFDVRSLTEALRI